MSEQAEKAFQSYDWDSDQAWKERLGKIELPAENEQAALLKLKRKYFKANVDSTLEIEVKKQEEKKPQEQPQTPRPAPTSSTSSSSSSSSSSRPTPSSTPQSAPSSSSRSTSTSSSSSRSRAPVTWRSVQGVGFAFNSLVVLFSLLSIFSNIAYRLALSNALASLTLSLWSSRVLGRQLLSREGLARFFLDDTAQYFVYCLIHLPFSNVFVVVVPIATIALVNMCNFILAMGPQNVSPLLSKYEVHLQTLTSSLMTRKLLENNAFTEVLLVFVLLLQVIVGRSGILHLFLHLQFLRFKYVTSQLSRDAWTKVSQQADRVFHHPMCPAVVGNLFDKVRNGLYSYGTSGQQFAR